MCVRVVVHCMSLGRFSDSGWFQCVGLVVVFCVSVSIGNSVPFGVGVSH